MGWMEISVRTDSMSTFGAKTTSGMYVAPSDILTAYSAHSADFC